MSVNVTNEIRADRNNNSKGLRYSKAILKAVATLDQSKRTMPADMRAILLFLVVIVFYNEGGGRDYPLPICYINL